MARLTKKNWQVVKGLAKCVSLVMALGFVIPFGLYLTADLETHFIMTLGMVGTGWGAWYGLRWV